MRLRSIIVDDELPAREVLREMLADSEHVEVIGDYGDAAAALPAILRDRPDLLFLDIQMPRRNGFELLQEIDPAVRPQVIFVTAHDEYAVRAFEVNALDYLLKPFDEERLRRAVERAVARRAPGEEGGEREAEIAARLDQLLSRDRYLRRIPVRRGEVTSFVRVEEIRCFEADGKYVRLHVGAETHLIRQTLQALERELDPRTFLRVSRSAIVNVDKIEQVKRWVHGDFLVVLAGGQRVTTTRGYRAALQRMVSLA